MLTQCQTVMYPSLLMRLYIHNLSKGNQPPNAMQRSDQILLLYLILMQQQIWHSFVHRKSPARFWAHKGALFQDQLQQCVVKVAQEVLIVLQHALCHLLRQIWLSCTRHGLLTAQLLTL